MHGVGRWFCPAPRRLLALLLAAWLTAGRCAFSDVLKECARVAAYLLAVLKERGASPGRDACFQR